MKVHKLYGKKYGPGGRSCPCCNPWNCNPRNMKKLERRFIRRKMKEEIRGMGR